MKISHEDMLKLKRWNTPTIYNGWEIISDNDRTGNYFNRDITTDFMPQQDPMVGRAVTVQCEPSNKTHSYREGVMIHADKHGFMNIPEEDQPRLLEACIFMDNNECNTVIPAARGKAGRSVEEILAAIDDAANRFGKAAKEFAGKKGEW